MKFKNIAQKIIKLKNADLQLRDKLLKDGKLEEGYNTEMEVLHTKNAMLLNEIIEVIGYPTSHKVGKEASDAAWLVIQHSIGQPEFMKKCKILLEKAVSDTKANPMHLVYLTDRIASFEGRPQRYGTQFDWNNTGEMNPMPYDDLTSVDERRKSVGLNSMAEQIEIMRERIKNENQTPPKDFKKRRHEFDKWRKKVGWIK